MLHSRIAMKAQLNEKNFDFGCDANVTLQEIHVVLSNWKNYVEEKIEEISKKQAEQQEESDGESEQ